MFHSVAIRRYSLQCLLASALVGCTPMGGWVSNNSGLGYFRRGNFAMAQRQFEHAVSQDPANADFRYNLAMAHRRAGNGQLAEQVLRQNMNVQASHQPTYHALAELMVEQGRTGDAHDLLQTWVGTQPYVPGAQIEMAWLQRQMGDTLGAEQSLRQAMQSDPGNHIAMAHLGQIYQDQGQHQQAIAMYQQSLSRSWSQPEVQSRLASLGGAATPVARSSVMASRPNPSMAFGRNPNRGYAARGYGMSGPSLAGRWTQGGYTGQEGWQTSMAMQPGPMAYQTAWSPAPMTASHAPFVGSSPAVMSYSTAQIPRPDPIATNGPIVTSSPSTNTVYYTPGPTAQPAISMGATIMADPAHAVPAASATTITLPATPSSPAPSTAALPVLDAF